MSQLISLLQTSLKTHNPSATRSIHAQIIKFGLHLDVSLMNNLVNVYAKSRFLSDAHWVFEEMPIRNISSWNTLLSAYAKECRISEACCLFKAMPEHDSVSWTALMVGYNQMGDYCNVVKHFLEMISHRVLPTQYTFTIVLASCAAIKASDLGEKVHSFAVKFGLGGCVSVANSLLNMYAKCNDMSTASLLFEKMEHKNVSSWNGMISLHMLSGNVNHALVQFKQMKERDLVSWNLMITGYNQHGFDTEALEIFSEMLNDPALQPNRFTLASVLSACANLDKLNLGKQIHAHIIRSCSDTSGAVGNALIAMYSKCGNVKMAQKVVDQSGAPNLDLIAFTALLDGYVKVGDITPARIIFNSLKERDVIAWTAMIVGYVQNGFPEEALTLFREMTQEGPKPNSHTLAATLGILTSLASLNHGKQIHAVSLKSTETSSISVSNALITMYAKAGYISFARQVFHLVQRKRDTVSWTSMIIALAQHGLGEEAIQLFESMLSSSIRPDHITYVGVLSACTHVGLVELGRRYYKKMTDEHGIVPTSSHCACMIDLYGRAGQLQEAQAFIQNMPIEPDVVAWGSLLASCRVHKNAELAKMAAENLLLIEPDHSGAYAALANVYSACGKWKEAAIIRRSMKDRQLKKEQGFSWIQVKDQVHVFGVDDGLHPQRIAIYQLMEKIWKEIKKMGFVPDVESVLHDLDYEVKDQMLKHHSEKLAIAFGLLNTPENTTLRIMKNLRVCNDCHSAIKFISKLVGREIIVRDATRFHHFKSGSCSCRDYWYLQKFEYLRKRVQYLLLVEGAFILLPRKMIRGLWSSPYSQMYSSCKFRRYLYSDDRTCVRAVYSIIIAVVCQ